MAAWVDVSLNIKSYDHKNMVEMTIWMRKIQTILIPTSKDSQKLWFARACCICNQARAPTNSHGILNHNKVLTALYNLDFENRSQFFLLLTGWTVFQNKWCLLLFFVGKREVAEFGPMAGIAGAALAIAVWCHQQLKYGFHWKNWWIGLLA